MGGVVMFHDVVNPAEHGTFAQGRLQCGEGLIRPVGAQSHRPVRFVAHPSAEVQAQGRSPRP